MAKPLSPAQRAAILAEIQGGSTNRAAIARKHGVSGWTVGKIAKDAGITDAFSRENTKNATRAREADSASRRAALAAALLDDVDFLRAKFRQEWTKTVVIPGVGTDKVEADSVEIATGLQRLMTSVGIALDKHVVLDKHDSDDSAGAAVDAWLRHVMGGTTPM